MTMISTEQFEEFSKKLIELMTEAGKVRDKLRDLIDEAESVFEGLDMGIDCMEDAQYSIQDVRELLDRAADEMSKYV